MSDDKPFGFAVAYGGKPSCSADSPLRVYALALTLEHRPNRTPEEEILLELLVTLIEKFEETHYPIPQGTPHSMLMHLIDARDITPEALAEVIGSLEVVREIVNGDSPSETLTLLTSLTRTHH